ncbi:MAG: hypothetical protein ACRDHD_02655 [Candidatus Limnocylindria bacterium]
MDPKIMLETILVAAAGTTLLTMGGLLFGLLRIASGGGILRAEDFPAPGVALRARQVEARMRARYMLRAQGVVGLATRAHADAAAVRFTPQRFLPEPLILEPLTIEPLIHEPAATVLPGAIPSSLPPRADARSRTRRRAGRRAGTRSRVAV